MVYQFTTTLVNILLVTFTIIYTLGCSYAIYSFYIKQNSRFPSFIYKILLSKDPFYYLATPLFKDRMKYINFFHKDYLYRNRNSTLSLVISTYERAHCLKNVFNHLIQNRPLNTEIIISDDSSKSPEKISLLNTIANDNYNNDVYVFTHVDNFGAFHNKLDGFLFSVGEFIMSMDDDDFFTDNYYKELADNVIAANNIRKSYNFIVPTQNIFLFWVKFPMTIKKMIVNYHNHVTFAFRKSLLEDVTYPNYSYKIIRDDAPLMIPLYIKSRDDQIYQYKNHEQYMVNRSICQTEHQTEVIRKNYKYKLNGLHFILNYSKTIGINDYYNEIRRSYSY